MKTPYYSPFLRKNPYHRLENSDENRFLFPFSVTDCLFTKTSAMENFYDRDEIEFGIDHFFELSNHFDLVGGGDIASKNRFLVMF